jgi:hypothetical protein
MIRISGLMRKSVIFLVATTAVLLNGGTNRAAAEPTASRPAVQAVAANGSPIDILSATDAEVLAAFKDEAAFVQTSHGVVGPDAARALRAAYLAGHARSWGASYLDGFAGAWVTYRPVGVTIGVSGDVKGAQATVARYFDVPGFPIPSVVRMPRSLDELRNKAVRLRDQIGSDSKGRSAFVTIDEQTGGLSVRGRPLSTKDRPDIDAILKEPGGPKVDWDDHPIEAPVAIPGGFDSRTSNGCTMAFAVQSPSGGQGVLTAGHCGDGAVTPPAGGSLDARTWERSWWVPGSNPDGAAHAWDRQIHEVGAGHTATPSLTTPGVNIRGTFLPAQGSPICRYGAASVALGQGTNFCTTVTGFDADGLVMMGTACIGGDSGGPSWVFGRAVGIAAATTNLSTIDPAGTCFEAPIKDQVSGTPFFIKDWSPLSSSATNPADIGLYHSMTPTRVLDTRGTAFSATRTAPLSAALPYSDVGAVVLSVTALPAAGAGFLTVYPGDTGFIPPNSNVNYQSTPESNLVIVRAYRQPTSVKVTSSNSANVLVDVIGYFSDTSATSSSGAGVKVTPVVGTRAYDSRSSTPLSANTSRDVGIVGIGGVPAGATDAIVNITVVSPTGAGFLTAHKGGTAPPNTSNINFVTGDVKARLAVVPLDASGRIRVSLGPGASSHVLVDILGYASTASTSSKDGRTFATDGGGGRLYDSRNVGIVNPGTICPFNVYSYRQAQANGTPRERVSGVWLNVTTTGQAGNGFASVFPSGSSTGASTINYSAGVDRANMVFVKLPSASDGTVCVSVSGAATHLIFDILGYSVIE